MSWKVTWKDREYDVDPTEFSGFELKLIKERTGFGCLGLIRALCEEQDGDALRVLFWVVDRRENQDLKFSEYDGPNLRVVLPHLEALNAALDEVTGDAGKAKNPAETRTTQTTGSPSSPSSTLPTETEPSTTS